jgi:tetratricopeptide (TPR) repeat protein
VELERAAASSPVFARTFVELGEALARAGRTDDAMANLRRAVELDERVGEAHAALAGLLDRARRPAEALAEYEVAVELLPDNDGIRGRLAELLLAQGRSADALVHFETLATGSGGDARPLVGLAMCQRALGRVDEAIRSLQAACERDAKLVAAWQVLAQTLEQQRRYADAVDALRRGLSATPDQPALSLMLAWLLATAPDDGVRDGAQAQAIAERLRDQTSGRDARVLDVLAAAHAEQGRFTDARAAIDQAVAVAKAAGQAGLVTELEARRALYTAGKPHRLP